MDRITAAKVFIEVVERQSQTAAAEHLDMSRAMVSRHLKALEEWVGTRLLHRTTRRLSLTDAGSLSSYQKTLKKQLNNAPHTPKAHYEWPAVCPWHSLY